MIKIAMNDTLRQKHIREVVPKIRKYLEDIERTDDNRFCIGFVEENIEYIVGAKADELSNIIEQFNTHCKNANFALCNVFVKTYTNWSRWTQYNPYTFVEEMGLKTCPYCNRNYIFSVDTENGKLRPEIDHFYPKSKYPFLAMSFGNLIPSCSVCNHTKSDTCHDELVNPYNVKSHDYYFTYQPKSIDFILVEKEKYNFDSFDIRLKGSAVQNRDIFKLKELYSQHKDVVLELLIKKAYYPESYIKELEGFGFSKDEIYRYLFSNYSQDEDLHKRPLSKLIKDISVELGLV
jgi:5-methylcytosine-specific restriction endonuclease McrA